MNKILKNILLVAAGVLTALLLLFIYSQFVAGSPDDPEFLPLDRDGVFVAAVSGEVFILRDNQTLSAQVGQSLQEGDVLKVVDQSYCQVQFAQKGSATLNSNTLLRIQRFFNAQQDMDIATEILMGSMLYRVNKTEENHQFHIESQGVIYEITGTEFLMARTLAGTRLSVTEGSVLVSSAENSWNEISTEGGQELFVPSDNTSPQLRENLSQDQEELLEQLSGLAEVYVKPELEDPVLIVIETLPRGADIYLDGRRLGNSTFQGLFEPGTQLNFRVRKRGYSDSTLIVETEAGENKLYRVELAPLRMQDTLRQDEEIPQEEDSNAQLIQQYQQEILQMQDGLSELQGQLNGVRRELEDSENQQNRLEQQLRDKDSEISRLKGLILQIQALAEQ